MFYGGLTGFGGGISASEANFYQDLVTAGLTTGLRLVLDAGSAESYVSGQKWLDISGNGEDFHFGAGSGSSTDDPTFNGVSGDLSSSEYMSFDGGDYFTYDDTIPTWMNTMHHDSAITASLVWLYSKAQGNKRLISTQNSSGRAGWTLRYGGDTNDIGFLVSDSDSNNINRDVFATALSADSWNLVGISNDEPTGTDGGFSYLNGAYNQLSSADTWDATYATPDTSAGTAMCIGAEAGAGQFLASGTRIAAVMVWTGTVISKANFDTIWAAQKGRFGL